jgi:xanthine dehydrogenase accessory factor
VIWEGEAEANTGIPEPVAGFDLDRVLRAPANGRVKGLIDLGTLVSAGETIAQVDDQKLIAPFNGALRGLVHKTVDVNQGDKIGDLDPRGEVRHCFEISDKALAIGGGVLEALLSRSDVRAMLGS